MSKQIEALRKLGLSDAEIEQVLADDKRIDKGEKLFELTAEQEKASKQARKADRAPTVYKLDNTAGKRSKKADSCAPLTRSRTPSESSASPTTNAISRSYCPPPAVEGADFFVQIDEKISLDISK